MATIAGELNLEDGPQPDGGFVDLHCHCLPGIDDGPATPAAALDLCRALTDDGITTVIATPHQLGRYDGRNPGDSIKKAVAAWQSVLRDHGVPLTVLAGAEARLDERIPAMLASGAVLTLADQGVFFLLELPLGADSDPLPLIRALSRRSVRTIIAHPERYRAVMRRPELARAWVDQGACLQVNAGSVAGDFGAEIARTAWQLLSQPFPLLVASDAHDTHGRRPRMRLAADLIERKLGRDAARRACIENPWEILRSSAADQAVRPQLELRFSAAAELN